MSALDLAFGLADAWPIAESSIAVIHTGGTEFHGDELRRQRLASVSKPLTAWAVLIAVEDVQGLGQVGFDVRERTLKLVHIPRHRVLAADALNAYPRHHRS